VLHAAEPKVSTEDLMQLRADAAAAQTTNITGSKRPAGPPPSEEATTVGDASRIDVATEVDTGSSTPPMPRSLPPAQYYIGTPGSLDQSGRAEQQAGRSGPSSSQDGTSPWSAGEYTRYQPDRVTPDKYGARVTPDKSVSADSPFSGCSGGLGMGFVDSLLR
jgi:hypothetical protein